MGLSLSLLPFDNDSSDLAFAHSILECVDRRELFEELMDLPSTPVPQYFTSYLGNGRDEESRYGKTVDDPYGDPVASVTVKQLLAFSRHEHVLNAPKKQGCLGLFEAFAKRHKSCTLLALTGGKEGAGFTIQTSQ